MTEERVRVGVVGLGFGARVHVPAFRAVGGVEVAVLASRDERLARSRAHELGVPQGVAVESLFTHDLDVVALAVPPTAVAPLAHEALRRRLGVFTEKPLAATYDEATRLVEAARGVSTAIDFEFAELDTFRALRDAVEQRAWGEVRSVDVRWATSSWALRSRSWSWKTDRDAGGGVLSLLGSHVLHLLEWLFGIIDLETAALDATATAAMAPRDARPAADSALLTAILPSGAPVSVDISNSSLDVAHHRWTVTFDKGTYVAENRGTDWVAGFGLVATSRGGSRRQVVRESLEPGSPTDSRVAPVTSLATRFIAAFAAGESCSPGFVEGARVQQLIARAESLCVR